MRANYLPLLSLPLLLAACQTMPSGTAATARPAPEGFALAQASCGGCHATRANEMSHRSNAPPFAELVNKEGVTNETLSVWLRDAHNYPSEMDFYLDDRKVNSIVAYMLTLKEPKYKRAPD